MAETGASGSFVWIENLPDPSSVTLLANSLGCPAWLASLLVNRGITTPESASAWLDPKLKDLTDPFHIPGTEAAVERIFRAMACHDRITVFGDYDVDGLTSVTLLSQVLRHAGADVSVFLPHRLEEGYGLSGEALERCITETRPNLIITVDCGTNSVDAVLAAKSCNIDVIVTDHHVISHEPAPAIALVNPRLSPDEKLHVLAGVGVTFKLCHALIKEAKRTDPESLLAQFDLRDVLDLVALGTIADLVPITHENRIFVFHGLRAINRTKRIGVKALIQVAQIKKEIDTYEVGYLLAPRLNASGRLGTAQTSLLLLQTGDPEEAAELAAELDADNRERQQVEKSIVSALIEKTGRYMEEGGWYSVVEADQSWHPGVIGIAAARIMQKYYRPTIVIGLDDHGRAKGSCRSVPGFNMVEALAECGELLTKHGGHAMAAGLELEWGNIDAFRMKFEQVARNRLEGTELTPRLCLDGWLDARDINEHTMSMLDKLRPFGMGYPEPVWACRGIALAGPPREVGKGHLKARFLCQGTVLEAIGFGLYQKTLPDGPIDAAFHLRKDTYMGNEKIVMHLKDFQPSKQ